MKTTRKHQCRAGKHTTSVQSRTAKGEDQIRLLINAACAARASAAQMTLNDWIEVEQEVERRLQYEWQTPPP